MARAADYIAGMARYTYQYNSVLRQILKGSDHPYPIGVGILK